MFQQLWIARKSYLPASFRKLIKSFGRHGLRLIPYCVSAPKLSTFRTNSNDQQFNTTDRRSILIIGIQSLMIIPSNILCYNNILQTIAYNDSYIQESLFSNKCHLQWSMSPSLITISPTNDCGIPHEGSLAPMSSITNNHHLAKSTNDRHPHRQRSSPSTMILTLDRNFTKHVATEGRHTTLHYWMSLTLTVHVVPSLSSGRKKSSE